MAPASDSSATCAYRSVVVIDRCPSSRWMTRKCTPSSTRCDAKLCRRSCTRTCRSPARASHRVRARFALFGFVCTPPPAPGNTHEPALRPRHRSNTSTASSVSGIVRRRLPLVEPMRP